jgi:hypothetical protein
MEALPLSKSPKSFSSVSSFSPKKNIIIQSTTKHGKKQERYDVTYVEAIVGRIVDKHTNTQMNE